MKQEPKNERGGRGRGRKETFLSSPAPPCSFTCAIFRAVFDSCSSFFAPKPHRNACYRRLCTKYQIVRYKYPASLKKEKNQAVEQESEIYDDLLVVFDRMIEVLRMKILPFFNIWCIHFFQSYLRFQTTEFVARPFRKRSTYFFRCGSTTNGVRICKRHPRIIHQSFQIFLLKT